MAIENFGLHDAIVDAVGDIITVRLHAGNPGTAGTANRVTDLSTQSVDIAAGASGWTIHATEGSAEVTNDLDFGNATSAITGVNWYSMFKGTNFFARRLLSASMDIADGAPVTLTGSTIDIEFTSTDS